MGIDPVTHKSIAVPTDLSHMTQWENARLEAEARLARQSTIVSDSYQPIYNKPTSLINKVPIQPFSQPQPLCLDVLNHYALKGPQGHISTSSFYENYLSFLPNINNQSMPSTYLIGTTEPSFTEETTIEECIIDFEILNEPFNILNIPKEGNVLGVDNLMYHDNYVPEALMYHLANNPNKFYGNDNNY
ncbi:hypothetical protein L1887_33309 [Cichorium endivia]|nr:hypothetical protein L1887_33309 [Cichorium endivia]